MAGVVRIPYSPGAHRTVGGRKTAQRRDYRMGLQALAGTEGNRHHRTLWVVTEDGHRGRHTVYHGVCHHRILCSVRRELTLTQVKGLVTYSPDSFPGSAYHHRAFFYLSCSCIL